MQLIQLRKNSNIFKNKSFLVIGQNTENLMLYLAEILNQNKKIIVIDPKSSDGSYTENSTLYNCEFYKQYDSVKIGEFIHKWSSTVSNEEILMILHNCFTKRNNANLFYHETEILFRRANEMNVQLIVSMKNMVMPHKYYRFFDFILIDNPKRQLHKISTHFPVNNLNVDTIAEGEYLFIDNRSCLNYNSNMYYYGKNNEVYTNEANPEEVLLPDGDACCICLSNYVNGDIMIQCRSCHNYGHQTCLLQWYEHNANCPLCRSNNRFHKVVIFIK